MAAVFTVMKLMVTAAFLSAIHTTPGCQAQASRADDDTVLYACDGSTLTLPWTIPLRTGDVIHNATWRITGRRNETLSSLGQGDSSPSPALSRRSRQTTNLGLEIDDVTTSDTGDYSLEVLVQTAEGEVTRVWRSAYVIVTDGLQTTDGQLHVRVSPVAEYDNGTEEYHVVLQCGIFTYPTHPPFNVSWSTPSGQNVSSSYYLHGRFALLIPNPVEEGLYTCHVPPSPACLHSDTVWATAKVDKVEARLAILEAKLEGRTSNPGDTNTVADLERQLQVLRSKELALETEVNQIRVESDRMKAVMTRTVSFHARLIHDLPDPPDNTPLVLDTVVTNIGNAYNPTTGLFTAPNNGTYFFIASTEDARSTGHVTIGLVVDNTEVDYVVTRGDLLYQAGSVHAVVRLTEGQNVWVRYVNGGGTIYGYATAFSGFLVSRSDL